MCGLGLAYLIGGKLVGSLSTPEYTLPLLGTMRSWQVVFVILAIPDLVLGLLVLFTVVEPARRGQVPGASAPTVKDALNYSQVFRFLVDNRRAFGPMYLGLLLNCIALGGNTIWMPAFYQRTHGWGPADFGVYQGWVLLILAPAGLMLGGWLAERLAKRGVFDANLRVVVWACFAHIPFAALFALMPNPWWALAFASLNTCVIAISTGPQNAAFQAIVPNNMRAKITATYLFMFTVGQAIGPILVGFLTTYLFGDPKDLRYSLALTHGVLGTLAAVVFLMGMRAYGTLYQRAVAVQ
jgi:MFS family permease